MKSPALAVTGLWLIAASIAQACDPSAPRAVLPDPTRTSPSADEPPATCSRERVPHQRKAAPAMAFARGRGPVYVGLGSAGSVPYARDARSHGGWFYNKVLIGIAPHYRHAVSINGRRTDGREILKWNNGPFPGNPTLVLDLGADRGGSGWSYWAGDMLIRAPGCYVIRIEARTFVEQIPFRAIPERASNIRCAVPEDGYTPSVEPGKGHADDHATFSGAVPLYRKNGEYAGPNTRKIELWWNLDPDQYASAVAFGRRPKDPVAEKSGPVLWLGKRRVRWSCNYKIRFSVPYAAPGNYPIVGIHYGRRSAAMFAPRWFQLGDS